MCVPTRIRVAHLAFAVLLVGPIVLCGQEDIDRSEDKVSGYGSFTTIRDSTAVPKSLEESHFWLRYVGGKYAKTQELKKFLFGSEDDKQKMLQENPQVEFKGDKHWNIKRFFYEPLFPANGERPIEQMKASALKEAYVYFLALNGENRDAAWKRAVAFMVNEIDPLLNSSFHKFRNEAAQVQCYFAIDTVYRPNVDETNLLQVFEEINRAIREGTRAFRKGPYTKREALTVYEDYFRYFRKDDVKKAKGLAQKCFAKEYSSFQAKRQKTSTTFDRNYYKNSDFE